MVDKTVNSNVGVTLDPKGMTAAAQQVEDRVNKIALAISQAGSAANAQLKAMALGLKQIQTLQAVGARQTLGNSANLESLGKQARAVAEYRAGISKTSDAVGVLRGRLRSMNIENGKLVQAGKAVPRDSLLKAENIERTATAYGKAAQQVNGLRSRISLMGEDSRRAFKPMLDNIDALDAKNKRLFGRGSQSSFGPQIGQMERAVGSLREQVILTEKQDLAAKKNLDTLRAKGQQILNNTRLEREALLAGSVRSANREMNNRTLLGGQDFNRNINQQTRLERATRAAAAARSKLNIELSKPAAQQDAARIQKLTSQYDRLTEAQGRAIAAQGRLQSENKGGFLSGLKQAPGNMFSGEGGGAYGAGMLIGRVASYAVAAGAIYGVISAIQQGISFAIQFEDALAQLQAISGSTAMEMDRLSAGIIKVSKNSVNSIMELTKSATIIAQAGYAGSEIETLLENVVNLAGASGSSTDEAVDILTSALGSFQLAASEATQVTDALVSALNDSKLSVNQVQLGLQYVGATARLNNITFNELVATLGAMADAGIRSGSTMSTGLRQMLVDFLDPSKKLIAQLEKVGLTTADIDVKVLGLTEVLTRLRDSGFQAYGALETRAAAAFAVLSQNIEQIERLEQATLISGAAEAAQEARLDSLSAKWNIFMATLGEFGIMAGDSFIPTLKTIVEIMTSVTQAVIDGIGPIFEIITALTELERSLRGSLAEGIGETVGQFVSLSDVILPMHHALEALAETVKFLTGTTSEASLSGEDLRATLEEAGATSEEVDEIMFKLGGSLEDATTFIKDAEAEMASLQQREDTLRMETQKLILRYEDLSSETGGVTKQTEMLAARFPELRTELAKTKGGVEGLITAMVNLENQTRRTLVLTAKATKAQIADKRLQGRDERIDIANRAIDLSGTAGFSTLNTMISQGRWRDALSHYDSLSDNNPLRRNSAVTGLMADIGSSMQSMISLNASERQADDIIAQSAYLDTYAGQQVQHTQTWAKPIGERTSSQGSFRGVSREGVLKELNTKEIELVNELSILKQMGNEGGMKVVESALSSVRAAISQATEDVSEDKKKPGRGRKPRDNSARLKRDFERINAKIQKEEVEAKKKEYENILEQLKDSRGQEEFNALPETLEEAENALRTWLEAEAELAVDSIKALNPNPEQRAKMQAAAAAKMEEFRIDEIEKIADNLTKVISSFLKTTNDGIERQYREAMRFTERNLGIAQARLQGLSDPLDNNTPDYMKTLRQRDVDIASRRNDEAELATSATQLAQKTALLAEVQKMREELETLIDSGFAKTSESAEATDSEILVLADKLKESGYSLQELDKFVEDYSEEIYDLGLNYDFLKARLDALNGTPRTFEDGLKAAYQSVELQIGAADSLGQELIKNLDTPLKAVHGSFKSFFSDVLSGTKSIGSAFKDMAGTIIDAILDMVAVALANQFFKLIGSALGLGTGLEDDVAATMAANPGIFWNGGQIKTGGSGTVTAKRMYGGGAIASGIGTRDSTLVHAAKDEYLIRRPAAQSLGKGFLDAINARGANALKDIGPTNMMPMAMPTPVETNVYVISPEEKPQLGPNDVIAIFSRDVLKGGTTKQLIKKVSSGG